MATTTTIATTTTMPSIYTVSPPPEDHITTIAQSANPPAKPTSPDYGLDSLTGLLMSLVAAPLYLYATLKGKSSVWDDILDALPDSLFSSSSPVLDVGCGRGLVLLKLAQRQKKLNAPPPPSALAYGIDIFSTADQTGNSPEATYRNAAALGVVGSTALHTASFAETFPFVDGAFSLVTSNVAIHNARRQGRLFAVREMARVCRAGGCIIIVDLYGYFGDHKSVLKDELGWTDVHVSLVGWKMVFGILPCQMLVATKPQ